jgi:hypothetical protein
MFVLESVHGVYDMYSKPLYSLAYYRVILSVLDFGKCEYLEDHALHLEHTYMSTYLALWETCPYYRRCWKYPPPLSRQSRMRCCTFANVTCKTSSSLLAATSHGMFVSSSCIVRGLLTYTFPFNAPHRKSLVELGQEILVATNPSK